MKKWLLLLLTMMLPSLAWAQTPTVGENGECPESFADYLRENDELAYSIIEDLPLFQKSQGDLLVTIPEPVTVGMRTQLNQAFIEDNRILVGVQKPERGYVCGWAPRRFILENGFRPMRVTEFNPNSPNNKQDIEVDGKIIEVENPLYLKALLRSNAATDSTDANPRRVELYDSPLGNRRKALDVGIFNLYFVYKIYQAPNSSKRWFFIAGPNPVDKKTTAGWVPEDSMFAWETQVSLYFNDQTTGTNIYTTNIGLIEKDESKILAGHPRTESIEPASSNIARFPILTHINKPYDPEDIGERETRYQIGFFGESCDEDTGKCTSAQDTLENMSENVLAGNRFRNVDILYLMDNTRSMSPYFKAVVTGVQEATKQMNTGDEENGVNLRFAAATYGDFTKKAETPDVETLEFEVVANFADYGETEHLDQLTATANDYFKDAAYADLPEAGSAALIRAASDLNWSESAGVKIVVWIGDHGDRQDESLTARLEQAAKLFSENGIMLNAINVAGNFDETYNANFIAEANTINAKLIEGLNSEDSSKDSDPLFDARSNQDTVRLAYDDETKSSTQESVAQTKELVVSSILEINQEALALAKILQDAFEGKRARAEDISRTFPKARLGSIAMALQQSGYDQDTIDRISNEQQLMIEGWVLYREDLENFDFWINIPENNMRDFQRVIGSACAAFQTGNIEGPLEDAMINLATRMSGDKVDVSRIAEQSVAEILVRYLFIPKEYFGSYLDYSPKDIVELWREIRATGRHDQREALYRPVCESAYLLDMVIDGKRINDPDRSLIPDDLGYNFTVKEGQMRDFSWAWNSSSGITYYYIPADYLPGRIKRYQEIAE